MKLNYCTLFDTNYLARGLAMYESLKKHSKDFHLYILAFDDEARQTLEVLNLEHITVISMAEFESPALLEVKKERSRGEYCWTATSNLLLYTIEHYQLDHCTYLDADLYFFSDPAPVIEEAQGKPIIITPHRYTPGFDQSKTSGIFCVQFVYIKNNKEGMEALRWWAGACIDWCYARVEDGKFGDQKYLDNWPEKYTGTHISQHHGAGLAPWNVQQYRVKPDGKKTRIIHKESNKEWDLVFYHFHDLKFLKNERVFLGYYPLAQQARALYGANLEHIEQIWHKLESVHPAKDFRNVVSLPRNLITFIKFANRIRKGYYNIYKQAKLIKLWQNSSA